MNVGGTFGFFARKASDSGVGMVISGLVSEESGTARGGISRKTGLLGQQARGAGAGFDHGGRVSGAFERAWTQCPYKSSGANMWVAPVGTYDLRRV